MKEAALDYLVDMQCATATRPTEDPLGSRSNIDPPNRLHGFICIQPTNERAPDQLIHNHFTQYESLRE